MKLTHPKIINSSLAPAQVPGRLEFLRGPGKKIVFTNGCFDLVHPGHVDLLARARALGDFLVVGLNSDQSVRGLGKGPQRPVNPFAARAFVLAHLEAVDLVVEFEEATPLKLIELVRPQVLVKGGDYDLEQIVGRREVEAVGGTVLALPLLEGWSTTGLLQRLGRLEPGCAGSGK